MKEWYQLEFSAKQANDWTAWDDRYSTLQEVKADCDEGLNFDEFDFRIVKSVVLEELN